MNLRELSSEALEIFKNKLFSRNKEIQSAYFLNIFLHFGDRLSSILLLIVFIRNLSNHDFSNYSEILVWMAGMALLCDFGTGTLLPIQIKKGLGLFPIYLMRGIFFSCLIAYSYFIEINFTEKVFLFSGVFELICRSPQFFVEFISHRKLLQSSLLIKQFFVLFACCLVFYGEFNYDYALVILSLGSIVSALLCLYAVSKEINNFQFDISSVCVMLKSGSLICLAQILYFMRSGLPLLIISSYDLSIAKEFRAIGAFQSLTQQITYIICGAFYSFMVAKKLGSQKFFREIFKLSMLTIFSVALFLVVSSQFDLFNLIFSIKLSEIFINFLIGMISVITIPLSLGIICYLNAKDQSKNLLFITGLAVFFEAVIIAIYCVGLNPHLIFMSMGIFDLSIILFGVYFNRELLIYIKRYLKIAR
jgi:hypothetical protein